MVTQELLEYISLQMLKGKQQNEIVDILVSEGWKENDIHAGFNQIQTIINKQGKRRLVPDLYRQILILSLAVMVMSGLAFVAAAGASRPRKTTPVFRITPTAAAPSATPVPESSNLSPSATITLPIPATAIINCGTQEYRIGSGNNVQAGHPQLKCFIEAAKKCAAAKLVMNSVMDVSGVKASSNTSYAIGKKADGCRLDLYQGKVEYSLPEGLPEELLAQVIKPLKSMENKRGYCVFTDYADLAAVFEKLDKGDIYNSGLSQQSGAYVSGSCGGEYFESLSPTPL